jgi:hypothetical protein
MRYPLAWYITWTTYGTWLHGDPRGSFMGKHFIATNPELQDSMRAEMTSEPVFLTDAQRAIVDKAIATECEARGWVLHERNVRTNHVHVVVSAARDGTFVRARLKAVASDALSNDAGLPLGASDGRRRWWTEKGNIVEVDDERALVEICAYVRDQ